MFYFETCQMRGDNQGLHTITIFQLMCKGLKNSSFLFLNRGFVAGEGMVHLWALTQPSPLTLSHPCIFPQAFATHNSYSRKTTGNPEIYHQLPWRRGYHGLPIAVQGLPDLPKLMYLFKQHDWSKSLENIRPCARGKKEWGPISDLST